MSMHEGWCPDCDLPSVIVDHGDDGTSGWAECTECGEGWVHRDERPERAAADRTSHAMTGRRAA